jgi:hypothetical protein
MLRRLEGRTLEIIRLKASNIILLSLKLGLYFAELLELIKTDYRFPAKIYPKDVLCNVQKQKSSAVEISCALTGISIRFLSVCTHTPRYLNGILSLIFEPPLCGTNPHFDLFLWKKEKTWLSLSWQWVVRSFEKCATCSLLIVSILLLFYNTNYAHLLSIQQPRQPKENFT